jgi:biotin transporter BioY
MKIKSVLINALYIMAGALCIYLGSLAKLNIYQIPFTLQTFSLIIISLFIPKIPGIYSSLLYLVLGLFLDIFAGSNLTYGYLFSFPIALMFLYELKPKFTDWFSAFSWLMVVHAFILFCGTFWIFSQIEDMQRSLKIGFMSLLPGAIIKSVVGALLYVLVNKYFLKKEVANR